MNNGKVKVTGARLPLLSLHTVPVDVDHGQHSMDI